MKREMSSEDRKTGLECLGNISWGQHICAFYETREDLLEILVPFFKSGLGSNELCIWVLSEGLTVKDALSELSKKIEGIEEFIGRGQLKIINNERAYAGNSGFNPLETLQFWEKEESKAIHQGFNGIRISGSGNFVKDGQWQVLVEYERDVNKLINAKRILAICTYSFNLAGLPEILAIGVHHSVIVAKKESKYAAFESSSFSSIIEHFHSDGTIK